MELVCSIMAFVHDSSVLYVLQYRVVILEYRFLCSFPCTLSVNKPSVYFSPAPRKEREVPVVPVSLVEHFSPTLLELCFSNPVSYYWDWYISLFRDYCCPPTIWFKRGEEGWPIAENIPRLEQGWKYPVSLSYMGTDFQNAICCSCLYCSSSRLFILHYVTKYYKYWKIADNELRLFCRAERQTP